MKFTGEELSTGCIRTFAANFAVLGEDREDRIQADAGPDSVPRPHWLRTCTRRQRDIRLRTGADQRPAENRSKRDAYYGRGGE